MQYVLYRRTLNDLFKNTNTDSEKATALPPPNSASYYFYPIIVFEIKKKLLHQLNLQTLVVSMISFPNFFKLLPDTTLKALAHIFLTYHL